jgi:SlyX protein
MPMADLEPTVATLLRRIEALEMHAAHRDRAVEDLNAAITEQWKTIDNLARQLRRVGEQIAEIESAPERAPDPPPPHY